MKNKNHLIFFLFVIFIITTSCRHNISQIEISLVRSGDNRPELEKVIEHYFYLSLRLLVVALVWDV